MYAIVTIKGYKSRLTSAVVGTDLWQRDAQRQVGMGRVMTSGSLSGVRISTLARNAKYVDSIPVLGAIFPIFITPMAYKNINIVGHTNIEGLLLLHRKWNPGGSPQ